MFRWLLKNYHHCIEKEYQFRKNLAKNQRRKEEDFSSHFSLFLFETRLFPLPPSSLFFAFSRKIASSRRQSVLEDGAVSFDLILLLYRFFPRTHHLSTWRGGKEWMDGMRGRRGRRRRGDRVSPSSFDRDDCPLLVEILESGDESYRRR